MKKHLRFFGVFLVLSAVVFSCKKDPAIPATSSASNSNCRITRDSVSPTVYTTYDYDSLGKISKITYHDQSGVNSTSYTYSGNTVTTQQFNSTYPVTYTLGANAYASSSNYQFADTYYSSYYTYDSLGYLIKQKNKSIFIAYDESPPKKYIDSTTTTYSYSNGNRVSPNITYTDKPNKTGLDKAYGTVLVGKPNKNLVQSQSFLKNVNGNYVTHTDNFSYEFDSNGYATKITDAYTEGTASSTVVHYLFYSCK